MVFFFFPENLPIDTCLKILQGPIDASFTQVIENSVDCPDEKLISEGKVVFQHDGCPAHYTKRVRDFFKLKLPYSLDQQKRDIFYGTSYNPDLVCNDIFWEGKMHIKPKSYNTPLNCSEELKKRIIEGYKKISQATFHSVRQEFLHRLYYCQKVSSCHF